MAAPIAEAYVELRVDDSKLESGARGALNKIETRGESAAEGVEASFKSAADSMERDFEAAAGNMKEDLEGVADGDGLLDKFKGIGGEAGGSFLGGLSPALVAGGGVAAIGGAAAAALVIGFNSHLAREDLAAGLQVSLGLTEDEAARAGAVAGRLYRGGWGESLDDTAAAVEATLASFPGSSDTELASISEEALAIAEAFDIDVATAAAAAGLAVKNGLAGDGGEALDQFAAGLQKMPVQFRDELFEASNEYGQFFAQLGIEGDEAFNLLAVAAEDGVYGIDKTGDAIKELTIKATDGSEGTVIALKAIGLDAEDMADKLLTGGEKGREGFDEIIAGLLEMDDPLEQSRTAIALFGAPLEDLGTGDIPDFLGSLADLGDGLEDVEGTAEGMAATLGGTTSNKMEAFKREAIGKLGDLMSNVLIPAIEDVVAWFQDELMPQLQELYDAWSPVIDDITAAFDEVWAVIQTIFETIMVQFNIFIDLLSGDWAAAWDGILEYLSLVWTLIGEALALAWELIKATIGNALTAVWTKMQEVWDLILEAVKGAWNSVLNFLSETWSSIVSSVTEGATDAWNAVVDWVGDVITTVGELPGKAVTALANLGSSILGVFTGMFTDVLSGIGGFITDVVSKVAGLPGKMLEAMGDLAGSITGFLGTSLQDGVNIATQAVNDFLPDSIGLGPVSLDLPDNPIPRMTLFAKGGIVDRPTPGIFGEAGREALVPLDDPVARDRVLGAAGLLGSGPALNIEAAYFTDAVDADMIAYKTMRAVRSRSLTAA